MKQFKFYGIGGQGVVTAAKILSVTTAMYEGRYASTVPTYGHERRGAPVYTDVIIDERPIRLNCFVYDPDVVVVLDDTITESGVDIGAGAHENTVLVLNTGSREIAQRFKESCGFSEVYWADATGAAAKHIGRGVPSGSILGVLAKAGLISLESAKAALADYFGVKAGGKNADAAAEAYGAAQKC